MAERETTKSHMPAWGIALSVIAALMLLGLVIRIVVDRPGPERHALWDDPDCDVLAKVVTCVPSPPWTEYAVRSVAIGDRRSALRGDWPSAGSGRSMA
jgi:hypothetical protein